MKKERVLVTGAAGFIGSNLCLYLLEKDYEVVGLDNFSTGNKNNLLLFINHPNFSFEEGDITNFNICLKITQKIDYVLHQAALGSVPRSIKDPITTNNVNINGFLNIIEASKINSVKRFIYAASSSTYGDSNKLPKVENIIGKPLSPYAVTKYVNELYAEIYSKQFALETIGLRYFNVFGKHQDPHGVYAAVIPKFIYNFLNNESPIINGDGSYSRDFTYIENVLQMNYLAITTRNTKAVNQIYNTAVGDRVTILQVAKLIQKGLTSFDPSIANININFGPQRDGDIPHSQASIDKASNLLNYRPSHNFEEGLKDSLMWYYNNLKINK